MPASADSGLVADSRVRILGVIVERSASGLRASLDLDPALGVSGAPARTGAVEGRPPAHFQLQLGNWGRVVYNGRHSDDRGWWYEKVVANVALLVKFDSQVFLRDTPAHELNEMAEL